MKNQKKLALFSFIIFIISTAAASYWYILLHYYREHDLENISTIITQVGLVAGAITTFIFFLINLCIKKIKDKGLRSFLVVILVIFFIVFVYHLTLNMVFYHTDSPQSFIESLMEF
ncbi:hypothetical protein [Chryseobacterium sp. POE27]|uniref:hypothetical protein n=1 Tax=Chryseobacterium sp. POE27 TaxID=3138177 RepID=UPI00321B77BD